VKEGGIDKGEEKRPEPTKALRKKKMRPPQRRLLWRGRMAVRMVDDQPSLRPPKFISRKKSRGRRKSTWKNRRLRIDGNKTHRLDALSGKEVQESRHRKTKIAVLVDRGSQKSFTSMHVLLSGLRERELGVS